MYLPSPRARAADLLGVSLSFACLVHCLALPLLILLAPAIGHWIVLSESAHGVILLLALPAALVAMSDGWRRHRRLAPVVLAIAGLALLSLGLAAHEGWVAAANPGAADQLFTSLGAVSLASAHLANWRLRHRGAGRAVGA